MNRSHTKLRGVVLAVGRLVVGGVAVAGCGGGSATHVAAGQAEPTEAAPATTTPVVAPTIGATPSAEPVTDETAESPVDGLSAAELKAAVEAPAASSRRSLRGPQADQLVLADGTRVWRVVIPGTFPARDARVAISVGATVVGEGVLAPDLASITAVTTDPAGIRAGAAVTYRWEGGEPIAAGTLAVAR